MTRIGLLSDTHGWLDDAVFTHFDGCDEVWHGGDFGSEAVADALSAFRPLRGVYGNIDGAGLRARFPLRQSWACEGVTVFMTHIGGYPGRYSPGVAAAIGDATAGLFISGHSHILKVIYDDRLRCLHMNPGAAGRQGWHQVRTLLRFTIDGSDIRDCSVVELGRRSQ
jgi:putative phosphoesterase